LWDKVEKEYETCSEVLSVLNCTDTMEVMQAKYVYCYSVFERCAATLNETIERASVQPIHEPSMPVPQPSGCRVPPIDYCEIFSGDYVHWPTFRDIFSAIYVQNPRLSGVEKLFHLNSKTSGEAKSIVALSPLTNEGFESAWGNLQTRFENKRLLVNSQLKIPFNLPTVSQECGNSLKHLESTVQGCLTALKIESTSRAMVKMSSLTSNFKTDIEVIILPQLMADQPSELVTETLNIPRNIHLADPRFREPGSIDLVLGADIYPQLTRKKNILLGRNKPLLQDTNLGWIVVGPTIQQASTTAAVNITIDQKETLTSELEKFWKMDTLPVISSPMTAQERLCEEHFLANVKMEKRLQRDASIRQGYVQFMDDYERLNHMTEIDERQLSRNHYFIPQHCVLKPDSSTTKLRVVFDASATSTSGKSLNDILRIGPTVQGELLSILLRFRCYRFVFTADIEKMYKQIWVHPIDRNYQLILWRKNPTDKIRYFRLNTVTYGTACAPYLATRCLQQLAITAPTHLQVGATAIKQNFYVDDCLSGADTLDE
ncbi:hypothetical protein KR084_001847, partial [Drosophila pseudotakahashii]